jgi:hypothetical protein
VILYSALDAPIVWTFVVTPLVPIVVGAAVLWAGWSGKGRVNGLPGMSGRIVLCIVGALFFVVGATFTVSGWRDTVDCRNALRSGEVTVVTGKLSVDEVVEYRAAGHIKFSVGELSYSTQTKNAPCDCGYIQALGSTVQHAAGSTVKVKLHDGAVVSLEIIK